MTHCPRCGIGLPETRQPIGCCGPVWASCQHCSWPLNRDGMIDRLRECRDEVTTVLTSGHSGAGARTLTGSAAQAVLDGLLGDPGGSVPVCESAGLVAFRRAGTVDFFLFLRDAEQSALDALIGR